MFADRKDLYDAGVHGTKEPGIFGTASDGGAFAIVLNGGYEDDDDRGETIIYTGEGKGGKEGKGKPQEGEAPKSEKAQRGPQDMKSPRNAALLRNVETGLPVRVIRGPEGNIKFCPSQGYRYDGLYTVVRAWMEEGVAGFKMCRFELKRCLDLGQPPLPLHITGEGPTDQYWSPDGTEALAGERERRRAAKEAAATKGPARTVQARNQEIAGHKKLPGLKFKRTASAGA
ncbi:PUA-like domain-containing protein [Mycena galericulata]|nr:PUA-like domain-containing protein [Mycena galericulata]